MKGRFLIFISLCICYSFADTFEGSKWSKHRRQARSTEDTVGVINPDCPLDDDPNNPTLLQYPGHCSKFYKCSFGKSYVVVCPYGLHWHVALNRCDSPFFAKCKSGSTVTTVRPPSPITRSTTTRTTTTRTTTRSTTPSIVTLDPNLPIPMPECSDVSNKDQFGIAGECKWFYKCFNGIAFKMQCREGREWSWTQRDCIDAALAGCSSPSGDGGDTTRRTTIRSTSTTRMTTPSPTTCEEGAEYLSHPTDCHKFIQCDNDLPVEKECPGPLFFNKKIKRCEWTASNC